MPKVNKTGNRPTHRLVTAPTQEEQATGAKPQRVGSGWAQTSKNGQRYISIQLGVWDKETKAQKPVKLEGNEKLLLFKQEEEEI